MRFRRVEIDGYGRFTNCSMEIAEGLQVIVGPNEQGKSTLRSFITEMLYGQKRSTQQRLYDDSNELRVPWAGADGVPVVNYGGRLTYVLDSGRVIEVFRCFDRQNEKVQIFDLTHARDITSNFPQLKNREPLFAQEHAGISKEVFLSAATIGHMTLEDLGDYDALGQIREKILSLADSGDGGVSSDAAIKWLQNRISLIGQPAARTRPLPSTRSRLAELHCEMQEATRLRAELSDAEERRHAAIEALSTFRRELSEVDAQLTAWEAIERAHLLEKVEGLDSQLAQLTPRCFTLREVERFPLEERPEFLRAEMVLDAARKQHARVQEECSRRRDEAQRNLEALGGGQTFEGTIPEEYDQRLMAIDEKVRRLRGRLEEIESARDGAKDRLDVAERDLASMPDFSRVADDPIKWLSQLASTFRIAQNLRDEESGKRESLRQRIANQEGALSGLREIFDTFPDFEETARDYEVRLRTRGEQTAQLENSREILQMSAGEFAALVPGFAWPAALTAALFLGLLITAITLGNNGIFIATALVALSCVYFLGNMFHARSKSARITKQLEETEARIGELKSSHDEKCQAVESVMVSAKCQTIRELEALHDRYVKGRMELESLLQAASEHEERAQEAEQRLEELFSRYCDFFCCVGETLRTESDVEESAGRAIARYQSYRDAKRRVAENRDQIKRHDSDAELIRTELDACRQEELELGLLVREKMREVGFTDEAKVDSVLTALRSYRIRSAQTREKRQALVQTIRDLDATLESEKANLLNSERSLQRLLDAAGVETPEQWHAKAARAEEYAEVMEQIDAINSQLDAALNGRSLTELRAAVESQGPLPPSPSRPMELLKRLREQIAHSIDARTQEEHALHLMLTERTAGTRSSSEIEEETAQLEWQLRELEVEMEAASHAAAIIEDVARDRHSRIAPKLASLAGTYLAEITDGAYDEVLISRDLNVSVRIPAIRRMTDDPERVLSKGTVDQVYFALRLALVQCISENAESVPMLLDDPFANYDDHRLQCAMRLLAKVAERNQVLLFTCREDVARAARSAGAPPLVL